MNTTYQNVINFSVSFPFSLNSFPVNVAWDYYNSCDSLETHISELKMESIYDIMPSIRVTKSVAVTVASLKSL